MANEQNIAQKAIEIMDRYNEVNMALALAHLSTFALPDEFVTRILDHYDVDAEGLRRLCDD